jgi:osmotically-inducible protein OsmY
MSTDTADRRTDRHLLPASPSLTATPETPDTGGSPQHEEHFMSAATQAISNSELQSEVELELRWDPTVVPASVGVSAVDHTVTLSGTVHHYSNRMAEVRAAKRVRGVHAIADDIVVEPAGTTGRTDHDIAEFAEHALKWSVEVPDTVKATVRDGAVTLDGTVDWNFQRKAAARAVEYIAGVRNVSNNITLRHVASSHDVHERITTALRRSAEVDASAIHVAAEGGHVHLTGSVSSWAERERAERAAWSAPGVARITDEIVIR